MGLYGGFVYGTDTYGQIEQETQYLNNIALLVGGARPDPVNNPYFYSGVQTGGLGLYGQATYGLPLYGELAGVSDIKGCYSRPPFVVEEAPCGIVFTGRFKSVLDMALERQDEFFRLVVLVKKVDSRSDFAILNKFRDSIPAAFRNHLTLLGASGVLQAFVSNGRALGMEYGGETWWAWEFTVSVLRLPQVTYTTR